MHLVPSRAVRDRAPADLGDSPASDYEARWIGSLRQAVHPLCGTPGGTQASSDAQSFRPWCSGRPIMSSLPVASPAETVGSSVVSPVINHGTHQATDSGRDDISDTIHR
eukprot:6912268-Pyramimonas_sp.AAC.1